MEHAHCYNNLYIPRQHLIAEIFIGAGLSFCFQQQFTKSIFHDTTMYQRGVSLNLVNGIRTQEYTR
jgi:hypothetical protein